MRAQLKKKPELDGFSFAIRQWLSGEQSGHLGPFMYTDDHDDHRWKEGHSASAYYVGNDEKETFKVTLNNLNVSADNFLDLGPGGEASVRTKSIPIAQAISAKNYLPVDLSPEMAHAASQLVTEAIGIPAHAIITDFYEKFPVSKPNSFMALLGLTFGNIETHHPSFPLQLRLRELFWNYRQAIAGHGFFLVSIDCNTNARENIDCYHNKEFGSLVRSCIERAIDTTNFDYDVVWTPENYQLATGLRSKCDQIVAWDGERFALEEGQFLPVLNSYRFPELFVIEAASKAGWTHKETWTATGRVHHLLFEVTA